MLPSSLLIAVSLTVILGFAGLLMVRRRAAYHSATPDWDWAKDFSLEKYRPMQRLLCPDDYAFLKVQRGYQPSMARTLRQDRRRVFRSYLASLRRDFNRLYHTAKVALLLGDSDQAALMHALVRQRMIFYVALCLVEFRLGLYALGIGTVDIRPVLGALEAMRDSTRVFQPVSA